MNRSFFSLTALLLALLGTAAWSLTPPSKSSTGTLTGKVLGKTGRPVAEASVEILKTSPKLGAYTREDGTFRVLRVPPGTYRLKITARGFAESDTVTVTIARDKATNRSVILAEAPAEEGDEYNSYADGTGSAPPSGEERSGMMDMESAPLSTGKIAAFAKPLAPSASRVMTRSATSSEPASPSDDRGIIGPDTSRAVVKRPGQLTAGEWSDLMNWGYWKDITSEESWKKMLAHWKYNPAGRIPVRVSDGDRPVVDAEIRLVDQEGKTVWQARTNNRGWGELFAGINSQAGGSYRVEVKTRDGYMRAGTATPGSTVPVLASLPGGASYQNTLDMMFMIDATGSMGDELNYIKRELEDVIDRIRETSSDDLRVRLSCNVYRDHGDDYVVRDFPFNESSFEVVGQLRDQWADGGGDTPEAVEDALENAINAHEWSQAARARLLFLVLDAPPHYTPERIQKLHELTRQAAAKGIRIIPIASSGIDKETEFLLRFFSIYTEGTYLFLTDDSGIGGSHLKPTIGRYDVQFLNDAMVKVIGRYVADERTVTADNGMQQELR